LKPFRLKNRMLFANFISNLIGVLVVTTLSERSVSPSAVEFAHLAHGIDLVFIPLSFVLPLVLTLAYERPIRFYLDMVHRKKITPSPQEPSEEARRRLLNEPFFLIGMDFGLWLTAAVLYPAVLWSAGAGKPFIMQVFFRSLFTGLITSTIAFFVLERVLQRTLAPLFFPGGGLYRTPRTLRIRISTRLGALLFACNLIPFIAIMHTLMAIPQLQESPAYLMAQTRSALFADAVIFMGVGISLTILVSGNLTRPLQEIIRVLQGVRGGIFDQRVRVTSNDEIGYTGDVINEMNLGLQERELIKETFGRYVTREIRDEILSGRVPLDGELKVVTVLFADLRNFTAMVESMAPKEAVKMINRYFKEMEEAIRENQGLVLQYIGDEIEGVFGAPIFKEDHSNLAVRAALAMCERLDRLNQELQKQGYPPLAHGIGIHTGEAVAASIGGADRLSYALVGDTVNVASRLQGLNKEFGTEIILSATTSEGLNDRFALKSLPPATLKGKTEPVQIYTVLRPKNGSRGFMEAVTA